jgi:hypothetical protein
MGKAGENESKEGDQVGARMTLLGRQGSDELPRVGVPSVFVLTSHNIDPRTTPDCNRETTTAGSSTHLIPSRPSPCRRTCPTFSQTQRPNTTHSDATSFRMKSTATPKTTLTCAGRCAHTTLSKTEPSRHGSPMIPGARRQCSRPRRLHQVCDNNHHNKHLRSTHPREVVGAV